VSGPHSEINTVYYAIATTNPRKTVGETMNVKFAAYVALSTAAAGYTLYAAHSRHRQFYSTAIYLTSHKMSLAVLGNCMLALALLCARVLTAVFFGPLRPLESESLSEHVTAAAVQTMIALTMFREDLSIGFSLLFLLVLFMKSFLFLASARFKHLQTTPVVGSLKVQAYKVGFLFALLGLSSCYCLYATFPTYDSYMLLFLTEWLVLLLKSCSQLIAFVVYMVQLQPDGTYERRGSFLFYVELASDILQLAVLIVFFVLLTVRYGFPLYFLRDVLGALRRIQKRVEDVVRYRRMAAHVDSWFPDVDVTTVEGMDRTCAVCREEMRHAKRLQCGHAFHKQCLLAWVQQNNSCPLCRQAIVVLQQPHAHTHTHTHPQQPQQPQQQQQPHQQQHPQQQQQPQQHVQQGDIPRGMGTIFRPNLPIHHQQQQQQQQQPAARSTAAASSSSAPSSASSSFSSSSSSSAAPSSASSSSSAPLGGNVVMGGSASALGTAGQPNWDEVVARLQQARFEIDFALSLVQSVQMAASPQPSTPNSPTVSQSNLQPQAERREPEGPVDEQEMVRRRRLARFQNV
jgi:E3 ubiquitin-protein ligase synoviolin